MIERNNQKKNIMKTINITQKKLLGVGMLLFMLEALLLIFLLNFVTTSTKTQEGIVIDNIYSQFNKNKIEMYVSPKGCGVKGKKKAC